jgi:hypothetical protein
MKLFIDFYKSMVTKFLVFVGLFSAFNVSFAFEYAKADIVIPNAKNTTVFYGETLYLPITMNYYALRGAKYWTTPSGTWLQNVSGTCPSIAGDTEVYWSGSCQMHLVVPGDALSKVVQGSVVYRVQGIAGKRPNRHHWDIEFYSPNFQITVVPHTVSMTPIAVQKATAGMPFHFNMSNYIQYYSENAQFGMPPQGIVTPASQNGLYFDPVHLAIVGKPQNTGTYVFSVGASNARGTAAPTELTIEVLANPSDTPVFKKSHPVASVIPMQHYTLNLLDLLEEKASFLGSNEVTFSIDRKKSHADWLDLSKEHPTLLEGKLPLEKAGSTSDITLIAHSNSGGDSLPITLEIPMGIDPLKKPVIHPISLEAPAAREWRHDLSANIENPTEDASLRLILEKVEPYAPWLHVAAREGTVLTGLIPEDATGQLYQLTLRANSLVGGSSDSIIIPLQIAVDKARTPRFIEDNPLLPLMHRGLPYHYDFEKQTDIFPEFQDIPYQLSFALDHPNPAWMQIVDNKLLADMVPEDLDKAPVVWVVIKNKPGGASLPFALKIILAGQR